MNLELLLGAAIFVSVVLFVFSLVNILHGHHYSIALLVSGINLLLFGAMFWLVKSLSNAKQKYQSIKVSNRSKDQFLALLSHELRNSLTPVMGALDLLQRKNNLPEGMAENIDIASNNLRVVTKITNDLLDLAKISSGKVSFEVEDVNVHECLENIIGSLRRQIEDKRIRLFTNLSAQAFHMQGDYFRLAQILLNIVNNAIKYTPSGGYIQVLTRNTKDWDLEITISDSGVGMSKETTSHLFAPTSNYSEGLGIGLQICYQFCKVMGGEISAKSQGIGKGATFKITFPTIDSIQSDANERFCASDKAAGFPYLKFLLVEDHPDTAKILAKALSTGGGPVQVKNDFASALRAVQEDNFDCLVFDIGLPDGTGIELLQEARKHCDTPAIAVTGYGMPEDVQRAAESGFDAHLCKPVKFEELKEAVLEVTSRPKMLPTWEPVLPKTLEQS